MEEPPYGPAACRSPTDRRSAACGDLPSSLFTPRIHAILPSLRSAQLKHVRCNGMSDGALVGEQNVYEALPRLALDRPLFLALEPEGSVLHDPH